MLFITLHNLDHGADEHVNPVYISRLRDTPSRDDKKCIVSFSSGDTMNARASSGEIMAMISAGGTSAQAS